MVQMNERELAVYEDARNMANIAIWGVELQIKRLFGENEIDEFVLQPVVDFHFLVTSLNRLRQAAGMVSKISDISSNINKFDLQIPDLRTIRNILEHIDEYRVGKGRNKTVPKDCFQTILFGKNSINWAGYEINTSEALKASQELFATIHKVSPNNAIAHGLPKAAPLRSATLGNR